MRYLKELDGVRAIAVLLVIVWHWTPQDFFPSYAIGGLGVDLFFVLSGFLITQILLSNRQLLPKDLESKRYFLKSFYARRFLRIVPIYLLTVVITAILGYCLSSQVRDWELLAASTFTTNFYVANVENWQLLTVHLWSVSVEEQFYLVWGLLLTLLPFRALLPTMLLFVVVGFMSQYVIHFSEFDSYLMPQSCAHALGAGGILAWTIQERPIWLHKAYPYFVGLGLVGLLMIVLQAAGNSNLGPSRPGNVFLACWLLLHLLLQQSRPSLAKTVLRNKMLVMVGKLSYGLYLYHLAYHHLASRAWHRLMPLLPESMLAYQHWLYPVVMLPPLIWFAWLSWIYIEKPILAQKRFFSYQPNVTSLVVQGN